MSGWDELVDTTHKTYSEKSIFHFGCDPLILTFIIHASFIEHERIYTNIKRLEIVVKVI